MFFRSYLCLSWSVVGLFRLFSSAVFLFLSHWTWMCVNWTELGAQTRRFQLKTGGFQSVHTHVNVHESLSFPLKLPLNPLRKKKVTWNLKNESNHHVCSAAASVELLRDVKTWRGKTSWNWKTHIVAQSLVINNSFCSVIKQILHKSDSSRKNLQQTQ